MLGGGVAKRKKKSQQIVQTRKLHWHRTAEKNPQQMIGNLFLRHSKCERNYFVHWIRDSLQRTDTKNNPTVNQPKSFTLHGRIMVSPMTVLYKWPRVINFGGRSVVTKSAKLFSHNPESRRINGKFERFRSNRVDSGKSGK